MSSVGVTGSITTENTSGSTGMANDRLPGTTYDNPIWFGDWRIYLSDHPCKGFEWCYVHKDYDGPEDNRHGFVSSVEEAQTEIGELYG